MIYVPIFLFDAEDVLCRRLLSILLYYTTCRNIHTNNVIIIAGLHKEDCNFSTVYTGTGALLD